MGRPCLGKPQQIQSRAQAQAGGDECCREHTHAFVYQELTMSASGMPGWDSGKTQTQTLLPRLKKRNVYMHRLASERAFLFLGHSAMAEGRPSIFPTGQCSRDLALKECMWEEDYQPWQRITQRKQEHLKEECRHDSCDLRDHKLRQ